MFFLSSRKWDTLSNWEQKKCLADLNICRLSMCSKKTNTSLFKDQPPDLQPGDRDYGAV